MNEQAIVMASLADGSTVRIIDQWFVERFKGTHFDWRDSIVLNALDLTGNSVVVNPKFIVRAWLPRAPIVTTPDWELREVAA